MENQYIDFEREDGMLTLPEPTATFPRFKKLPTKPNLTVWEQFARKKGIQKKKSRNKKVWSDELNDYVYRYGSQGVNNMKEKMNVAQELKDPNDLSDPFENNRKAKKMQVKSQKIREMKNSLIKKGIDPK